jgi:hypothetical protein
VSEITLSIRDFPRRTLVRNHQTGQKGVVVDELPMMRVCGPDEVLVVYEGVNTGLGTNFHQLEVLGKETAIADLKMCGAGRGAECCIFLSVGGDDVHCERFGDLRNRLIFSTMSAKRDPVEPFPACQIF